jgi:acyl-CoA thioester hydrolase
MRLWIVRFSGYDQAVSLKSTVSTDDLFANTFVITADAIDELGHVSNISYIAWMQQIAIQHSAARGWPVERYLQSGYVWVVRSHLITYLRPAFAGETITLQTWVDAVRPFSSLRKYRVLRSNDATLLAEAETNWVFVELKSGRPCRIPDDLRRAFATRRTGI